MSGACVQGDHAACPDSFEDTGTCSCPCHLIGDAVDAEAKARCYFHGTILVWEPGGADQPTIHGRTYCPDCQDAFNAKLDELDAEGTDA